MLQLEQLWDQRHRIPVVAASAIMIAVIALIDWWTVPYVSLGFLYLFPIMLAAGFIPRAGVVLVSVFCAALSEGFSSLDPRWSISRLALETLALAGCGLFVRELVSNRRLSLQTQQRLRALVETSPAAILTVDRSGGIELANQAARDLLCPEANLPGQPIARFVPELQTAVSANETQFRASMQCQVRRSDGTSVPAEVWFSSYNEKGAAKLAAIIVDLTEEQPSSAPSHLAEANGAQPFKLNERQTAVLRLVLAGLRNNDIASRLDLSTSAVKNTLQQLFAKAGVNNRSQLVRVALEKNRMTSDPAD